MSDLPVPRQRRLLLVGWLVPPIVWLTQLQLVYSLASRPCSGASLVPLLAITAVAALITVAVGAFLLRASPPRPAVPGSADDPPSREAFASAVGLAIAFLVLLGLAAQTLALAIVGRCG